MPLNIDRIEYKCLDCLLEFTQYGSSSLEYLRQWLNDHKDHIVVHKVVEY